MNVDIKLVVEQVLARAPQWIRVDLLYKEVAARQRAEEALAAMIADALAETVPIDR